MNQTMSGKRWPVKFIGEPHKNTDIVFDYPFHVVRVCPACEGTQVNPPRRNSYAHEENEPCKNTECRHGMELYKFKTVAELRTYVGTLQGVE